MSRTGASPGTCSLSLSARILRGSVSPAALLLELLLPDPREGATADRVPASADYSTGDAEQTSTRMRLRVLDYSTTRAPSKRAAEGQASERRAEQRGHDAPAGQRRGD